MVSKREIEHKFVCKGREKNSQEATNNHTISRGKIPSTTI